MSMDDREDRVDEIIRHWRKEDGGRVPLSHYLGMDDDEYAAFAERGELPGGYDPDYEAPESSAARVRGVLCWMLLAAIMFFAVAGLAGWLGGPLP